MDKKARSLEFNLQKEVAMSKNIFERDRIGDMLDMSEPEFSHILGIIHETQILL